MTDPEQPISSIPGYGDEAEAATVRRDLIDAIPDQALESTVRRDQVVAAPDTESPTAGRDMIAAIPEFLATPASAPVPPAEPLVRAEPPAPPVMPLEMMAPAPPPPAARNRRKPIIALVALLSAAAVVALILAAVGGHPSQHVATGASSRNDAPTSTTAQIGDQASVSVPGSPATTVARRAGGPAPASVTTIPVATSPTPPGVTAPAASSPGPGLTTPTSSPAGGDPVTTPTNPPATVPSSPATSPSTAAAPPQAPEVGAQANGNAITYVWQPVTNDYSNLQGIYVCLDSSCQMYPSQAGQTTVSYSCGTTHTITASDVSRSGARSTTSTSSATTAACNGPIVTVSWGGPAPTSICGGDSSCTWFDISWSNFGPGSHTVTPLFDGGSWGYPSRTVSGSSGAVNNYYAAGYGHQTHTATATVDGVASRNSCNTVGHTCS